MASKALTGTPWMAVLARIIKYSDDETTRALAQILYDIFGTCSDPRIAEIADAYSARVLGGINDRR